MDRIFANSIRYFRKRAKLTQAETAQDTGIAQSQVSRLEDGENWPGKNTILQLCKTFGISTKEFFTYMIQDVQRQLQESWFEVEEGD